MKALAEFLVIPNCDVERTQQRQLLSCTQISKQIQIAFSAHGIGDGLPGAIAAAAAAAAVVVPKANECYNDNYIVLMSLLLSLGLLLFPKLLNSSSSCCLSGCHPSSPCTLSDCIKNPVVFEPAFALPCRVLSYLQTHP
jgi:hypothetical protein